MPSQRRSPTCLTEERPKHHALALRLDDSLAASGESIAPALDNADWFAPRENRRVRAGNGPLRPEFDLQEVESVPNDHSNEAGMAATGGHPCIDIC
jgi:hypothetical protein